METLCSEMSWSHCEVFTVSMRLVVLELLTLVCTQWTISKVSGRAGVGKGWPLLARTLDEQIQLSGARTESSIF